MLAKSEDTTSTHYNTGYGPRFALLDIGLEDRMAVLEPDTAFWAIVERETLPEAIVDTLRVNFLKQAAKFKEEMEYLRFGLKPSAAYFNPTERCNFNCDYCYLPQDMRRSGKTMTTQELCRALEILHAYLAKNLPQGVKPQLIFHGSEPMMAREAMFAGIEQFRNKFHFGVQTNGSLLDDEAISFLTERGVGIGLSLDGSDAEVANRTRHNWEGSGAFERVVKVIKKLSAYPAVNVITTVTGSNVHDLTRMVDFYHDLGVGIVMFNPVRCTQRGGQMLKPENQVLAEEFCKALDRTCQLYEKSGRKLVIANFTNVLAAIAGPTSRRLMCDISPCGGGRCFFAVAANGDVFPCSEFIGFPEFTGGNLYETGLDTILGSKPFKAVTTRKVEMITPCSTCVIRHFCGAPCPAEVNVVVGRMDAPSPYCQFYEEQVRYAFRVIARRQESIYLWDGWQEETEEVFNWVG
jgi:uncharacterized protein